MPKPNRVQIIKYASTTTGIAGFWQGQAGGSFFYWADELCRFPGGKEICFRHQAGGSPQTSCISLANPE